MKKLYLPLLMALVVALSSCNNKLGELSSDYFTVTPQVLEANAGKVPATIDGKFPEKYFNKKAVVEVTPVLRWEGGEAKGQPTVFQGEKVEGNAKTVNYKMGGDYTMKTSFDYVPEMAKSELYLEFKARIGNKDVEIPAVKIADGVISTSEMVEQTLATATPAQSKDAFQRIIAEQQEAAIYYLINSANICSNQMSSEEMKKLQEYIKLAATSEDMNLNGIDIRSYASPDGTMEWNEKLANKREDGSSSYLKKQMKKNELEEAANEDLFKKYVVAEDWEGFQKAMEESNIQDKDLVLRVLSMHSDPEVREREIKNIASAFTAIADQILPKLRRSLFVVNAEKIGYSDEELIDLAKSNPSQLNVEELLYAATLFEGNEDKLGVYQACKSQFPNDWRGFNDAGMVLFQMGRVDEAKADFEKANSLSANNPVVQNNLGAVALKNGDLDQAEVYFGAATGAGDEVNYNKGIIAIKKGDYTTAVNYFGQCTCVNAALANILAGNNNEALNKLNSGEQIPMAYYLKAVIGARTNDDNMVMENLRKACEGDASLKAMAATDMEFAKYFENNDFVTITK